MDLFINLVYILCQVLIWAMIGRAVLSWFNLPPNNLLVTILYRITEPILSPLRRVVPRVGMIDITPMVAIILIWLILSALYSFA
jgi:YggT family protein